MITHSANDVAVRGEPLDTVWWQGRQWAVTEFGLEARDGSYDIAASRLAERRGQDVSNWVPHMAEKNWVDLPGFVTALVMASFMHSAPLSPEMVWNGLREAEQQEDFARYVGSMSAGNRAARPRCDEIERQNDAAGRDRRDDA